MITLYIATSSSYLESYSYTTMIVWNTANHWNMNVLNVIHCAASISNKTKITFFMIELT